MIKGIIFDFGGVLNLSGNFKDAMDKIKFKKDDEYQEFITFTKSSFPKSHLYEVDDFYNDIRSFYNVSLSNDEIINLVIEPNFKVINLLKELSKNYDIFILTAIIKGVISKFINRTKLTPHIKKVFETCKEHLSKKEPELIQRVIDYSKLKPNELIFIDDKEVNLKVANDIGVNTILYKDINTLKESLQNYKVIF